MRTEAKTYKQQTTVCSNGWVSKKYLISWYKSKVGKRTKYPDLHRLGGLR